MVFLDRDGTLIEDAHFVRKVEDVRVLPGAAEAVGRLNQLGIHVVVVTNQSGIARGHLTVEEYEAVRARLDSVLASAGARIDRSYFCPHHPDITGPCDCRKPAAGLFRQALRDLGLEAGNAAFIGDRWRDVAPALELGGRGFLIPSPMTSEADKSRASEAGIILASSITSAVEELLSLTEGRAGN